MLKKLLFFISFLIFPLDAFGLTRVFGPDHYKWNVYERSWDIFYSTDADPLDSGSTNYIQNRNTLQSGATFYVSSGTVTNLAATTGTLTAIRWADGTVQVSSPQIVSGSTLPLPEGATNYLPNSLDVVFSSHIAKGAGSLHDSTGTLTTAINSTATTMTTQFEAAFSSISVLQIATGTLSAQTTYLALHYSNTNYATLDGGGATVNMVNSTATYILQGNATPYITINNSTQTKTGGLQIDGKVGVGTAVSGSGPRIFGFNSVSGGGGVFRANTWGDFSASICGNGLMGGNIYLNYPDNAYYGANSHASVGGSGIEFNGCIGASTIRFITSSTTTVTTANTPHTMAERMRITRLGNVGINTASPSSRLHIVGDITASSGVFTTGPVGIGTTAPSSRLDISGGSVTVRGTNAGLRVLNTGTDGSYSSFESTANFHEVSIKVSADQDSFLVFYENNVNKLIMKNSSSEDMMKIIGQQGHAVGIGATNGGGETFSLTVAPGNGFVGVGVTTASSALEVFGGSVTIQGDNAGLAIAMATFTVSGTTGRVGVGTSDPSSRLDVSGGSLTIRGTNAGLAIGASTFFVNTGGKVSVSTTLADSELVVGGNNMATRIGNVANLNDYTGIAFTTVTAGSNNYALLGGGPSAGGTDAFSTMLNSPGGDISFRIKNIQKMNLNRNGNLSIGLAAGTPAAPLTVVGKVISTGPASELSVNDRTTNLQYTLYGTDDTLRLFRGVVGDVFTHNGSSPFFPVHGTTTDVGNVAMADTGEIKRFTSSRRYKKNIVPLLRNFKDVLLLEPKQFRGITMDRDSIGYIAEDLDLISGLRLDLVYYNKLNYKDADSPIVPDSVNYQLIPIYILEVVKEQEARINQLETTVSDLKRRLELLEALP